MSCEYETDIQQKLGKFSQILENLNNILNQIWYRNVTLL
jgi:hypothetical protein